MRNLRRRSRWDSITGLIVAVGCLHIASAYAAGPREMERQTREFKISVDGKPVQLADLGALCEKFRAAHASASAVLHAAKAAQAETLKQVLEILAKSGITQITLGESPPVKPPSPTAGQKLKPATEEQLKWGEAANGLRVALVRLSPRPKHDVNPLVDFSLFVQNVSNAPLRLARATDGWKATLLIKSRDRIVAGLGTDKPAAVDYLLQPREVALLNIFPPVADEKDSEHGSIAEGAQGPPLTFSVELKVEHAPVGAWTGTVSTAYVGGVAAVFGLQPQHPDGQALFKVWLEYARPNGNIPGGLVSRLREKVKEFIRNNTGDPFGDSFAKKMTLVSRFEVTGDWTPENVVALMDEIAVVSSIPLSTSREELTGETKIHKGTPLTKELAAAPWGDAQPNGLRLAWLLAPQNAEQRLNTPLTSRVLIHNSGKEAVVFRTRTWHQIGHHAHDAHGAEINTNSVHWTTRGRLLPYRLAPGEYLELVATGIGVGAKIDPEDWQHTRVGTWIDATVGDEVTVTTEPVPLNDWDEQPQASPHWWPDLITARLQHEAPSG